MNDAEDGTTVAVTSKGQATIPKKFRDRLRIDTPGRIQFIENERGEVVIRPVKRPSEIRGALASGVDEGEKSATELLREERKRDEKKAEEKFGRSGPDE
ncbi:AbrB/MazE/SpoVT family DNA-binding domain-containing protein [Halegenticoccus tardaugens]|uniref:AbrB/MazE/SpoVT family DNA-binding domain-containing protein n=1 Tax=Halegenticoccus tardaugens TaxID=2071624 RepID=UPI00100BC2A0|nr:AbrB/MazE/SpoVT family DNA-binding domain-containing protein [Halegenticoccus tardaugens]